MCLPPGSSAHEFITRVQFDSFLCSGSSIVTKRIRSASGVSSRVPNRGLVDFTISISSLACSSEWRIYRKNNAWRTRNCRNIDRLNEPALVRIVRHRAEKREAAALRDVRIVVHRQEKLTAGRSIALCGP